MPDKEKKSQNEAKKDFYQFVSKLENMILIGGFRPRERLVEANLSQMFGVSRYWVRDAFKILETKELVNITPFKGVEVRELSAQEVEEIFMIRVALERLAIDLATQNIKPDDIVRLRELADNFDRAREIMDTAAMVKADNAFHNYIFNLGQNQSLKKMITDLRKRCHILRYSAWSSPDILKKVTREHRLFVDYIESKDKPGLHELAQVHIFHAKDFYLFRLRAEDALKL